MRVVIVGAGYSGTEVIRQLVLRAVRNVEVDLISVKSDFENTIAGTEIISEKLSAKALRYDLKELSTNWGFGLTIGRVDNVDLQNKVVRLGNGEMPYDVLVVATGSAPNFFDVKGTDLAIQSYWLAGFELINRRLKQLDSGRPEVAVVGAGYVGLEVAAEALDLLNAIGKRARITVVEKMPFILPGFGNDLARKTALETLSSRGIVFRMGKGVREIQQGRLTLEDGGELQADLVVWSGGIRSSGIIARIPGVPLFKGYIDADERLMIRGKKSAFAIGDVASVRIGSQQAQKMAREALAQGTTVSRNIKLIAEGSDPTVRHEIAFPVDFPSVLLSLGEGKALLIQGSSYASAGQVEYFLKRRIDFYEIMARFPT